MKRSYSSAQGYAIWKPASMNWITKMWGIESGTFCDQPLDRQQTFTGILGWDHLVDSLQWAGLGLQLPTWCWVRSTNHQVKVHLPIEVDHHSRSPTSHSAEAPHTILVNVCKSLLWSWLACPIQSVLVFCVSSRLSKFAISFPLISYPGQGLLAAQQLHQWTLAL